MIVARFTHGLSCRVSEREELSVTVRFFVITSKVCASTPPRIPRLLLIVSFPRHSQVSQNPLSVVSPVVVV